MENIYLYLAVFGSSFLFVGLVLVVISAPKARKRQDLFYNTVSLTDVFNGRLQKKFSEDRLDNLNNGLEAGFAGDGRIELKPNAKISRHAVRRVLRHW